MDEQGNLVKAIIASVVSWVAAAFTWVEHHSAVIATGFAVVASIYAVSASRASKRLSDDKRLHPDRYTHKD